MRIFHNKTVLEIVEEILRDYAALGSPHLRVSVSDDYPVLEYTVQYGESDADFVRRQLERHGISWSWQHETGSHTLLLTDEPFQLPEVPGGTRPYYGIDGYHQHDEEHFKRWSPGERITTGAVRLTEYNFKMPKVAQEVEHTGAASHPSGDVESYDWPGDYLTNAEGRGAVRRRIEAERGQALRHEADGDVISLGAGWRVTLGGDEVPGATGRTFVCLKAHHQFRSQAYGSGQARDDTPYEGAYVLMPEDAPYRPERRTVGLRVQGPETAVVVGEGEIDCDEHGRILCRFHWDDQAAHTMRVRVSQNWASKGWGGMVIPRIGMEVIVEHLRGDPDKPIVTGCVYNGKNNTPYPLPEHKTKSVFRSDSHKSQGFNEFTFEDATGAENISLHAQKDQTLKVLNNRSKRIDNDQIESVGRNKSIDVGGNHQERIGGSMNLSVGNSKSGGLIASLAGLIGQAAGNMQEGSSEVGNENVAGFVSGLTATATLGEAASSPLTAGFSAAGGNAAIAGAAQASAGSALGAILTSVMPVSGVSSRIVEKAVSDTIGLVKTEQVGLFRNSTVGMMDTAFVGKKKIVDVGEELVVQVGKSKLVMQKDGTIRLLGDNLNITMSGPVQISGSTVDLN